LLRVRGCALMQLGRMTEARAALDESLSEARARGAEYEVALALDALVVLGRLAGDETTTLDEERTTIFERLGVVATPELPLTRVAAPR
jgi:hypothetical protein